ncbi:MAG: hypothetical protein LBJ01_07760 [Tannerella sp.]|jgi:hypothetical protein|nr:hypothetical protein [Tannerella sp.]
MQQQYHHFEYGESLARRLKAISHTDTQQQFYRATEVEELSELNARLSSASGMILVAIDGNNSDFGWKNSDSLMERPQYFFMVAKQTVSGDTDTVFTAQQECAAIVRQIIARMVRDHQRYDSGMTYLDESSFTARGVGPIGENFYGVILGFNMDVGLDCRIDQTCWNE